MKYSDQDSEKFFRKMVDFVFVVLYIIYRHKEHKQHKGGSKLKKRINIYLTQKSIQKADELARELSYKTRETLNRSNILEIALWHLVKNIDHLDPKTLLEEGKDE